MPELDTLSSLNVRMSTTDSVSFLHFANPFSPLPALPHARLRPRLLVQYPSTWNLQLAEAQLMISQLLYSTSPNRALFTRSRQLSQEDADFLANTVLDARIKFCADPIALVQLARVSHELRLADETAYTDCDPLAPPLPPFCFISFSPDNQASLTIDITEMGGLGKSTRWSNSLGGRTKPATADQQFSPYRFVSPLAIEQSRIYGDVWDSGVSSPTTSCVSVCVDAHQATPF